MFDQLSGAHIFCLCLLGHDVSTLNLESLDTVCRETPTASWVSVSLSTVTALSKLWKHPPSLPSTAAPSSGCPHGRSIEMSSSLLDWTTAASVNEQHSAHVEGDITGCNSPTPTRIAAGRLMSVCGLCWLHARPSKTWTSGQETSRGTARWDVCWGLQKTLVSYMCIAFKRRFNLTYMIIKTSK